MCLLCNLKHHGRRSEQWVWSGTPFIASWLIGPSRVIERASEDQLLGLLTTTLLLQSSQK